MCSSCDLVFLVFGWDGGRSSVYVDACDAGACSGNDEGWRRLFGLFGRRDDDGKSVCFEGKTVELLLLLDVDDDAGDSSGSSEEEEGGLIVDVRSSSSFILSSPVKRDSIDGGGGPFSSSLFSTMPNMMLILSNSKGKEVMALGNSE